MNAESDPTAMTLEERLESEENARRAQPSEKENALASAQSLKKTAAELRTGANVILAVGILGGMIFLILPTAPANAGFWIIAGSLSLCIALRFFGRLAVMHAELCRIRAALSQSK